ncbi:hypothetical protein F2Q70_00009621 [Brassica cretica]|uniref:F-box associated beta-propeller type 1 domain-containing protein n=1 Tax=Brassica cretica TaxID=69181 RepID=A0A8S9M5F5_BRACR|nr:hypothetical protein F2Q70_00009621 [Brassica cretica]
MHSFGYRANAILTFSVTALAFICAIASLSDNFSNQNPSAEIQILNINRFKKQSYENDEVSLTLDITADLESLFTWNTKQVFAFVAAEYETPKNSLNQVSLWDAIIPDKEHAKFRIQTSNKYRFIDQGHNLRGKEFNLTLHWHVMPKTGKMVIDDDLTPDCTVSFLHRGLSLKGNTYWYAQEKLDLNGPPEIKELPDFLLCFDFTTERFGPRLPLPFNAFFGDIVTLSSVGEEQLAVLLQRCTSPAFTVNIWITSKIEPNAVSWRNVFLSVDMKPLIGTLFSMFGGSFFVDEEKKVAVVLDKDRGKSFPPTRNIACIIGNNGYFKQVDLGESIGKWCYSIVCPYVPSSLQITRQLEEHTP